MKVPESGMPEEAYWESLFDVALILDRLGIGASTRDAVEFGCGYGTFTIPVARRIAGIMHTFDIEPAMIARTQTRAAQERLSNVRATCRDVLATGYGLPDESCDAALLFNILHFPESAALLRATARVLRPGGHLLAIHWRSDIPTPRGPPLHLRPKPEDAPTWAQASGLRVVSTPELPPWHFGVVLAK